MATYQDIVQAYAESTRQWRAYQDRSRQFASDLYQSIRAGLGIPEDQIAPVPVDKEPEKDKFYSVVGAMHLNDDSYWHMGALVTIKAASHAAEKGKIVLLFKGRDDHFVVKLNTNGQEFRISDQTRADDLHRFAQHVGDVMVDEYQGSLERFLNQNQ